MWLMCAALMTGCGSKAKREAEDAKSTPLVEVTFGKAVSSDIPVSISAPATVFAREQANVSGRVTAPIRRLLVRKGDTVRSGQVLAELENRDVAAQLAEAQGAVANAQASLEKTVSGTIPSDVEKARGQVETTKAALNQLEVVYKRRQSLFNEGAIPQRDLLQTQTDLATARANFEVAQRSYDLLVNQSRGRDEQIARAGLQQAQARLQGANAQLQFTEIRAPFSGVITDQLQYPGDMAQPTTPMFAVADLSSITVRAQVPESDAGKVKLSQRCSFQSLDQGGSEIQGEVTVVNRAVDLQRRTVEVWCEVRQPPAWVRVGMFGTATIFTGQVQNAVLVPKAALLREEGTTDGTVFVVDDKKIAHKRDVSLGASMGDQVQVASGVKAGETVVMEGAYGLPDKAQVTLKGSGPKKEEKEDKEGAK